MATPCTRSLWDVKVGGTSMEEMRGAGFAGSAPPFLGRERAAVDIDKPRSVWLRMPIVKNLKESKTEYG